MACKQFGYLLVRIMVVMVFFVLAVNQMLGRPALEVVATDPRAQAIGLHDNRTFDVSS